MILHDSDLTMVYEDFGIMLPVSASRADRVVESLHEHNSSHSVSTITEALWSLGESAEITREDVERVHHKDFVASLYDENLEQALLTAYELLDSEGKPNRYEPAKAKRPLRELFQLILAQVAGSYLACKLALEGENFCYYLAGGMHHARYDTGTGFCLINDVMIAALKILDENYARLIWIVDVDAHKGCGTAELVQFARANGTLEAGRNVFNLSIHMAEGWPLDKATLATARAGRAPLVQADVELPIGRGAESAYLPELEKGIKRLEELSGAKPDLVIVVAGSDPYEHDGLASSDLLRLTLEQCVERDRFLYGYVQERRIPSAWLMAGGYGERAWEPAASFLQSIG
jgi:acetoin utilization deacetylase AcuC-like enzyme